MNGGAAALIAAKDDPPQQFQDHGQHQQRAGRKKCELCAPHAGVAATDAAREGDDAEGTQSESRDGRDHEIGPAAVLPQRHQAHGPKAQHDHAGQRNTRALPERNGDRRRILLHVGSLDSVLALSTAVDQRRY